MQSLGCIMKIQFLSRSRASIVDRCLINQFPVLGSVSPISTSSLVISECHTPFRCDPLGTGTPVTTSVSIATLPSLIYHMCWVLRSTSINVVPQSVLMILLHLRYSMPALLWLLHRFDAVLQIDKLCIFINRPSICTAYLQQSLPCRSVLSDFSLVPTVSYLSPNSVNHAFMASLSKTTFILSSTPIHVEIESYHNNRFWHGIGNACLQIFVHRITGSLHFLGIFCISDV